MEPLIFFIATIVLECEGEWYALLQLIMPDQSPAPCICFDHERSTLDRPAIFIPIVLLMFASMFVLFALSNNLSFGLQLGSIIPYTSFVFLGTFSAQRGMQPYFFECPIVETVLPILRQRYFAFLVTVLLLETAGLYLTRCMPAAWLVARGKDGSPFNMILFAVCICIASAEVWTNRTVLERAHRGSEFKDQARTTS
jgi:hypothetical protein